MLVTLDVPSKSLLARNLKAARELAGLTQEEAATKSGFSKQAISGWERGAYTPTESNLQAVADMYGTTPGALRYGKAEDHEPMVYYQEALPTGVREAPRVALGIPTRIRVFIQKFLLELTEAGLPEEEVDRARRILTSDELHRVNVGGERDYTEDEILEGIEAHAAAFRQRFRRRGYKLSK